MGVGWALLLASYRPNIGDTYDLLNIIQSPFQTETKPAAYSCLVPVACILGVLFGFARDVQPGLALGLLTWWIPIFFSSSVCSMCGVEQDLWEMWVSLSSDLGRREHSESPLYSLFDIPRL